MRWISMLAAMLIAGPVPGRPAGEPTADLKLVTFNIRYGTAPDGENAWDHRRGMVAAALERLDGDVVGVQEALRSQLDQIGEALPGYVEVGVGRDDGRAAGEYSALLIDSARFSIAESGTFWLSDTPRRPGSMSWGNGIPRICTWARIIDKASVQGLYVFNTHLDHMSQPSRERAVELIAERIAGRLHDEPVVVMGDLNAGEQNPALAYLRGQSTRASDADAWPGHEPAPAPNLRDTFRAVHPDATEVGTFSGFRIGATTGEKIDHILVTSGTRVIDAGIDRTSEQGRYPSDHFAVWSVVGIGEGGDGADE